MKKTFLIVDDSADDQRLHRRALKDFIEYELVAVASAAEGLAYIANAHPDLILLDFNLPDMDGLGFIEKLKESSVAPIPVIMLTGELSTAVAIKVMKAGAEDYLVKDTGGEYLKLLPDVIVRALAAQAQRDEAVRLRRESEMLLQRNQALMQNSLEGIHIMDVEGNVIDVNEAFCEMLGYTREEALRLNVVDWDVHWTREELRERFMQMMGKSAQFETEQRRKDGSIIQVEITSCGIEIDGMGYMYATSRDITERKRNEAVLRRYKLMIDTAIDGFWLTDIHGNLLDANEAYANMSGYTVDELVGMQVSQLDALDRPEDVAARATKIMAQGYDRFETRHRHKDGHLIDVEVSINFLPEAQQCFVFCHDISERKRIEQALLEGEERWHFAIDGSGDGVWDWNLDTGKIVFSERYMEILGYAENVTWSSLDDWKSHVAPEDMQQAMVMLEAYLDGKAPTYHTEYRMRRADGGWAWMLARGKVVSRATDGRPLRLIGTHTDINERKQAAETLQKSEANLCAILDNAPFLAWLKDADGRYIMVNKVFANFLNLENARQAIGKTDLELQPHELAEKYRADDAEVIAARQKKHVEEAATDGKKTFWVETWKTPVIDAHDTVLGTVGFANDISERKLIEQEMRIAAVAFETHDAIVITDVNANIVRVNQAFTDVTGYFPEDVLGKNPRIMSSGRQDKAFYMEMWQQLLHTGTWAGEIWDKRKNGQIYPKWLTISAVRNERQETTHYVAIFSDITARKHAEDEIRNLAFYDALTRLPNRRLFLDRFRAALTISARRNDYGAVLFIDLDRFKMLNDTLGHDYGDLLLIEVADRIKFCVREMDTVARLGGDEFVVLIESVSEERDDASRKVGFIAEKIREALAHPYTLKAHEHHSSPSIGISLYCGNKESVDELIQQADMAMYQAKNAGRNAVRFFDPVMQYNVATRAELENGLHHAIALGQLQMHYQVQMDGENRPVGAEALLRWFHPERGVILPGQFISIAEESTLILEIGHWVLERACRQLALWASDARTRDLTLAVNVSAKQFGMANFVDQVTACLEAHGVAPASLKLELTESLVLVDLKSTISKMHALKKLGVKLSMDDFGTGYSSLSYLKQLPLDQIKIDQSFIQGITLDGNDAILVRTILDLAGNFRLNVIAEGVETEAQLAFLKSNDCVAYQGFLFGKPMPIEEFERLLGEIPLGGI